MTREELDRKAEQAAKDAKCGRCKEAILEQPLQTQITYGTVVLPAMRDKETFQLCGPCGWRLQSFFLGL